MLEDIVPGSNRKFSIISESPVSGIFQGHIILSINVPVKLSFAFTVIVTCTLSPFSKTSPFKSSYCLYIFTGSLHVRHHISTYSTSFSLS